MMALFGIEELQFIKADNLDVYVDEVDAMLEKVIATF